jgi:hypothetical protein
MVTGIVIETQRRLESVTPDSFIETGARNCVTPEGARRLGMPERTDAPPTRRVRLEARQALHQTRAAPRSRLAR